MNQNWGTMRMYLQSQVQEAAVRKHGSLAAVTAKVGAEMHLRPKRSRFGELHLLGSAAERGCRGEGGPPAQAAGRGGGQRQG